MYFLKRRNSAEGVQPYNAGDEDRGMQCSDDGETSLEIGKSSELRTLNVRRLRRLVSQYLAMEQPVNGDLERREVERYKKFSDSKLRNVRAAVSKWPYETYEARSARKELIRRD